VRPPAGSSGGTNFFSDPLYGFRNPPLNEDEDRPFTPPLDPEKGIKSLVLLPLTTIMTKNGKIQVLPFTFKEDRKRIPTPFFSGKRGNRDFLPSPVNIEGNDPQVI